MWLRDPATLFPCLCPSLLLLRFQQQPHLCGHRSGTAWNPTCGREGCCWVGHGLFPSEHAHPFFFFWIFVSYLNSSSNSPHSDFSPSTMNGEGSVGCRMAQSHPQCPSGCHRSCVPRRKTVSRGRFQCFPRSSSCGWICWFWGLWT